MGKVIRNKEANERIANQLEKIFPVVLGHESEEGQEGPAKRIKAGVTKVGVPPSLHACVSFWALPVSREERLSNYICTLSL